MFKSLGSLSTAAGSVPSPVSPFLVGAGMGLQATGDVLDAIEEEKRRKEEEERQKQLLALKEREVEQGERGLDLKGIDMLATLRGNAVKNGRTQIFRDALFGGN